MGLLALLAGCGRTALGVPEEPDPDAGAGDAGRPDPGPTDAGCDGPETCDGRDEDCDGRVDEGLDLVPGGPLQTLREDEFDTGSLDRCSSCAWAADPQLVPTRDGALLLFTIGIWGSREMPSFFGRDLDREGAPRRPVRRLDDAAVPLSLAATPPAPRIDGEALLSTILRVGSNNVPGLVFVGVDGDVRIVQPQLPDRPRRRAWPVRGSGDAILIFSAPSRTFIEAFAVTVVGGDGVRRSERDVALEDLRGGLVVGRREGARGPEIGVLVDTLRLDPREAHRFLFRFDGEGREIGRTELPTAEERILALEGTTEGWVLLRYAGRTDGPTERLFLGPEGRVVAGPTVVDERRLGSVALRASSGGRLLAFAGQPIDGWPDVPASVALWDPTGAPLLTEPFTVPPDERYPGEDTAFLADPVPLRAADGSVLLAWHLLSPDGTPNRIHLRRFACAP